MQSMHHLHGPLLWFLASSRWVMMAQMSVGKKLARAGKASVLIVDDQPIIRERLAEIISNESDLRLCGDADNPCTAFELVSRCKPDLVVTGLSLQDAPGLEFIKDL